MKVILFTVTFFGILGGHIVPPKSEMATQWPLKPAQFSPIGEFDAEELYCITEAIYYEARNQPLNGQLAVAIVIKNRIKSPRWPDNACKVVHEGYYWRGFPLHDQCQFSYWCDGLPEEMEDEEAWLTAQGIAYIALTRNVTIKGMENITHYHNLDVNPAWAKKLRYCGTIADHKFYCSDDKIRYDL